MRFSITKRVFISAGDPSGDIHAAKMMKELRNTIPNIEFIGIGGKNMLEQGLTAIAHFDDISVVGFWEVAKKYNFFKRLLNTCEDVIKKGEFDIFIPVDYPGFNIRLASKVKRLNIPVIYYIAPQLWAWGENRAKKLAGIVDKVLVVFPFEKEYFENQGINAEYVGHPLLDDESMSGYIKPYEEREMIIALLPGSRKQEVRKHLPLLMEVYKNVVKKLPNIKAGLAKSPFVPNEIYEGFIKKNPSILIYPDSKSLLTMSIAGAVKTGTSTLEAALCGMPFCMYYKTSEITYRFGKMLVNLPYISLVNILLNKPVVNEVVQSMASPINISNEILSLINNPQKYSDIQNDFKILKKMLGGPGASSRAAKIISDLIIP